MLIAQMQVVACLYNNVSQSVRTHCLARFLFNHYCCPAVLVLNGAILYATQSLVKLG